jgi:hypothetical protein
VEGEGGGMTKEKGTAARADAAAQHTCRGARTALIHAEPGFIGRGAQGRRVTCGRGGGHVPRLQLLQCGGL